MPSLGMAAAALILSSATLVEGVAQDVHVRVSPTVKTGIDGTVEFPTIQNALDHHPFPGKGGRVFIEIEPGVYHERVIVTQNHANVTLIGKGTRPEDTVITNSLNARQAGGTFFTETVELNGNGFEADNLTFENAAGDTGQAVAVANRSDRSVFKRCRFLGHQDTLFADYGRQYYVDSYIAGSVDYIFGNAAAVFDRDTLDSNGPGFITAQSRTSPRQNTGYVILNGTVVSSIDYANNPRAVGPNGERRSLGLGRPWRPYARTVFLHTALPADLSPAGWNNWGKASNETTAYYAESDDYGPGASPATRPAWTHQLSRAQAKRFLPARFLRGKDHWNPEAEAAKLP